MGPVKCHFESAIQVILRGRRVWEPVAVFALGGKRHLHTTFEMQEGLSTQKFLNCYCASQLGKDRVEEWDSEVSTHLSMHLPIYLSSIYPSIHPPVHPSIHQSIPPSKHSQKFTLATRISCIWCQCLQQVPLGNSKWNKCRLVD